MLCLAVHTFHLLCIVYIDFEWVVFFIKYLSLKSGAMSIGVFKGHHRNDNHHIDPGAFQMIKKNVVSIVRTFMCLPWASE